MKKIVLVFFLLPLHFLFAQQPAVQNQDTATNLAPLTVEKIMRDPKWIGASPSDIFWSPDGKTLYFDWNPNQATSDSLYFITLKDHKPRKATFTQRKFAEAKRDGAWNNDRTKLAFIKDHTLYLLNISTGKLTSIIQTAKDISNLQFSFHGSCIIYQQQNNLYAWNIKTGKIIQLTNFTESKKESAYASTNVEASAGKQEDFLQNDALVNSIVLRQRKKKKEEREKILKHQPKPDLPKTICIGNKEISALTLSPDGKYVIYRLMEKPEVKHTIVPNYVTRSGYTQTIPGRTVVGVKQPEFESYIYDRKKDTIYKIITKQIQGIRDIPGFYKYYPEKDSALQADPPVRPVFISEPQWNKKGSHAFVVIRSLDHKDRWIMLLNVKNGQLKLLDRQHDSAWIGGPGIGYTYSIGNAGWINENTIWYQSEKTGYSHLYAQNIFSKKQTALTSGKYEVQQAQLSPDRKTFYLIANKIEPGQTQFYQLNIKTGKQIRITHKKGGNQVAVSPNGKYLALLFSTAVHPWELYLQKNKSGTKAEQITHKAESEKYKSYNWRKPNIITFKDRDGFEVYASVYKPTDPASTHPGVIFVHGAGYLQDVKHYWSYYFREHIFINLLVDQGYTVMDIDYRGSAGYGRDWRTAIYRHMGGNDLEDIIDGAKYMVDSLGVNPKKLGLWGGSYGGFMTLMAMFKTNVFVCSAALRSVTDWAHYNHGYTSDILNLPQNDSIAYVQSSPIYFAQGLQGHLLMCHGIVDTNVHFQDIVRLTQKLIELGKKNWELAVYPVESHDFEEPSSWTDEYRRIFELFERWLK